MPKQTVIAEVDNIRTDTHDRLTAHITFSIEGMRNVPNLENLGKAADAAKWLFQQFIENSFNKPEVATVEQDAIRTKTQEVLDSLVNNK